MLLPKSFSLARLTNSMTALITYEGVHRLGRREPRALHADVAACMGAFGYAAPPDRASLVLDLAGDDDPELNAAVEQLTREYGGYPEKIKGLHVTDGREWRALLWHIPHERLEDGFERLAGFQARGGLLERRTALKLAWTFRFRDPKTRELLPGQDTLPRLETFPGGHGDSSSVVLNLGHRSSISLWFLFPFAEPDAVFLAYVSGLQPTLPVPLATKGWRRWTLTRSGEWRSRKLQVELGAG